MERNRDIRELLFFFFFFFFSWRRIVAACAILVSALSAHLHAMRRGRGASPGT